MDELDALLAAVESGDTSALGPLADWLEERGDSRADAARDALKDDPELIAQILYASFRSEVNPIAAVTAIAAEVATMALTFPFMIGPDLSSEHLRGGLSLDDCRREVYEALATRRHSELLTKVMIEARQIQIARLLALFRADVGSNKTT